MSEGLPDWKASLSREDAEEQATEGPSWSAEDLKEPANLHRAVVVLRLESPEFRYSRKDVARMLDVPMETVLQELERHPYAAPCSICQQATIAIGVA